MMRFILCWDLSYCCFFYHGLQQRDKHTSSCYSTHLYRKTRCHIQEDCNLHSRRCETLMCHIFITLLLSFYEKSIIISKNVVLFTIDNFQENLLIHYHTVGEIDFKFISPLSSSEVKNSCRISTLLMCFSTWRLLYTEHCCFNQY